MDPHTSLSLSLSLSLSYQNTNSLPLCRQFTETSLATNYKRRYSVNLDYSPVFIRILIVVNFHAKRTYKVESALDTMIKWGIVFINVPPPLHAHLQYLHCTFTMTLFWLLLDFGKIGNVKKKLWLKRGDKIRILKSEFHFISKLGKFIKKILLEM